MEDTATLFEPTVKAGTKPVKTLRASGLSVSIFPHPVTVQSREVTFYSVSLERTYKDKETDEFQSTHSLGRNDLLVGAVLLRQAWAWIAEAEAKQKGAKA